MSPYDLERMMLSDSTLLMARRIAACETGFVAISGQSGSGKTTLMWAVAHEASKHGREVHVVVPGPESTHRDTIGSEFPDHWYWTFHDLSTAAFERSLADVAGKNRVLVFPSTEGEVIASAIKLALSGEFVIEQIDTPFLGLDVTYALGGQGISNEAIAQSLAGIMSQLLLPRLCEACRVLAPTDIATTRLIYPRALEPREVWMESGCEQCEGIGTKGQLPVCEVVAVEEEVRDLVCHYLDTNEFLPLPDTSHQRMIKSIRERAISGLVGIDTYRSVALRNPLLRGHHQIESEQTRSSDLNRRLSDAVAPVSDRPPMVFVSHASKDRRAIEDRLIPALERAGCRHWYAKSSIKTAAEWERSILSGLTECDWFLLAMTPAIFESEWVKDELFWAIDNRPDQIIPVVLEPCDPGGFHIRLRRIQAIDLSSDYAIDQLVNSLLERAQKTVPKR